MDSLHERERRINDLTLEALAHAEAELREDNRALRLQASELCADVEVLRLMLSLALEKLAGAMARERRLRDRVSELSAQARELREAA